MVLLMNASFVVVCGTLTKWTFLQGNFSKKLSRFLISIQLAYFYIYESKKNAMWTEKILWFRCWRYFLHFKAADKVRNCNVPEGNPMFHPGMESFSTDLTEIRQKHILARDMLHRKTYHGLNFDPIVNTYHVLT